MKIIFYTTIFFMILNICTPCYSISELKNTSTLSPKSEFFNMDNSLSDKFYQLLLKNGKISIMTVCNYNMERSVLSAHLLEKLIKSKKLDSFVNINLSSPLQIEKRHRQVMYINPRNRKIREFDSKYISESKSIIMDILYNEGIFNLKRYQHEMSKSDIENSNLMLIFDDRLDNPRIFKNTIFRINEVTDQALIHMYKLIQIQAILPGFDVWDFKLYRQAFDTRIIPAIEDAVFRYQSQVLTPLKTIIHDKSV